MHLRGPVCPTCEDKLKTADPILQNWFHRTKEKYDDLHISWAFRDEASQNEAFRTGMSKLQWPHSAHNQEPARALDLFQLDSFGKAVFDPIFMTKLYNDRGSHLIWGGNFRTLGDYGHVELPEIEPNDAA